MKESLISFEEVINDDDDVSNKQPRKEMGICKITMTISYYMVLSFIQNGLTAIAIPTDLSIFSPNKTALISGLLVGLGCFINAFSPIIGHYIDIIGKRPLLVGGAFLVSAGEALLIIGLYLRSETGYLGFIFYFGGYLVTQVGSVILNTCFFALIADLSHIYPEKSGEISAIYGLYGLAGACFSYVAAGVVFPVSKNNHNFYWFAALLTLISNVALFLALPSLDLYISNSINKFEDLKMKSSSGIARGIEVLTEWFCSESYIGWRRVVLSRFFYFISVGIFGSLVLFFLYDCTNAKDPSSTMTIFAVISLSGSIIAAWPAGKLVDLYGPMINVIISGILMGIFFIIIPSTKNPTPIFFIIPIYGMAQQVYNVADLSMIAAVLPNDLKRARDMGGWATMEYLGQAFGSLLAGLIISFDGKSNETVSEHRDNDDDDLIDDKIGNRIAYTRFGYSTVFYPAGLCVFIASLILWPVRDKLQVVKKTPPPPPHRINSTSNSSSHHSQTTSVQHSSESNKDSTQHKLFVNDESGENEVSVINGEYDAIVSPLVEDDHEDVVT